MAKLNLVGDIGGTNSRFGLVEPGSMTVTHIERLKNDDFASLEEVAAAYLERQGIAALGTAALDVAGIVTEDDFPLTNRDWMVRRAPLKAALKADRLIILNDFQALAMSLPYLDAADLIQIGGEAPDKPSVKLVLGPGTGLGMASLAPLPQGGWMALPGELGHVTLPVVTQEEFDLRAAMTEPGTVFESEFAITGGGLHLIYTTLARMAGRKPALETPEAILKAALAGSDADAVRTLDHFIIWLGRLAGDAAMMMQAQGGVYLAGGIAPSIVGELQKGPFRHVFEEKGRLDLRHVPLYVIMDEYPAFKGCAAALIS
ncbi:glucokinase [Aestuariivirga sp. YIM B02566]|uniref:Glucokinase n=1 Tax=Taklimakanibacter albus TaxID=2800327 RepID=A0ACC5RFG7_9HYPH|nr:glucokinase [Aestuariivirga sp. YIM B02566]MBK1871451.1 glucokinase [Aestuariivirga sp. YIM B02566]